MPSGPDAPASAAREPGRAGNLLVLALLAVGALALLPLHAGPWWPGAPGAARIAWAAALVGAFAGGCVWAAWRAMAARGEGGAALQPATDSVLVAYASQTGFARTLAELTLRALQANGTAAVLHPLSSVDGAVLRRHGRALFVASTTGEGDPPDMALGFMRRNAGSSPALPDLRYAILALGDRSYQAYCAFGHQLEHWLRQAGAQPLFDMVEVDNGDAGALRHWQHHLDVLSGGSSSDWAPARYQRWRLAARHHLNPGSAGGAVYHLALQPEHGASGDWQAGDIAEIGARNSPESVTQWLAAGGLDGNAVVDAGDTREPLRERLLRSRLPATAAGSTPDAAQVARGLEPLPHREYSIASIPAEGTLQLLVRRMQAADGSPGLGSGYLCAHLPVDGVLDLRLRANHNFRAPEPGRPLILVGNGTGMAGLRAHLAARARAGSRRNWLFFGERNAAVDYHMRADIEGWLRDGTLARVETAFSRDPATRHRYVQDALRACMGEVAGWLDEGAAMYVCGSLQGMAPGVDAVLRDALGGAAVDALLDSGRYRRDVY